MAFKRLIHKLQLVFQSWSPLWIIILLWEQILSQFHFYDIADNSKNVLFLKCCSFFLLNTVCAVDRSLSFCPQHLFPPKSIPVMLLFVSCHHKSAKSVISRRRPKYEMFLSSQPFLWKRPLFYKILTVRWQRLTGWSQRRLTGWWNGWNSCSTLQDVVMWVRDFWNTNQNNIKKNKS